jgi:hypothetical protein
MLVKTPTWTASDKTYIALDQGYTNKKYKYRNFTRRENVSCEVSAGMVRDIFRMVRDEFRYRAR